MEAKIPEIYKRQETHKANMLLSERLLSEGYFVTPIDYCGEVEYLVVTAKAPTIELNAANLPKPLK